MMETKKMTGWKLNSKKAHSAILALFITATLGACGGNPPPLPPPPPNQGPGFGWGGGINQGCARVNGVQPLRSNGQPYVGTLIGTGFGPGGTGSISAPLFYAERPDAGLAIQNIVGSANLQVPQLSPMLPWQPQGNASSFCVSTTDAQSGVSRPGRYASVGAVQAIMTGLMPISFSPYNGYPGGFFQPGTNPGIPGFGTGQDLLEVRIGYSCDAWVTPEGRLYGCIDILAQYLGVYLSMYSQ